MRVRKVFCLLLFTCLASSCSSNSGPQLKSYPTYDPFLPLQGAEIATGDGSSDSPLSSKTPGPTPTRAPISVTVPAHKPDQPLVTPTPDHPRVLPTARQDASQYTVQSGDTLGSIAQSYGLSVEALKQANNITDENLLAVGQTLDVPPPAPGTTGSAFKIIPDSELVNGPGSSQFDIEDFINKEGGYLSGYTQDVSGETLTGSQVVTRISQDYSVNPRLLLALLEYRTQWVSNTKPKPGTLEYPLGYVEPNRDGLYHQLAWAANELNRGFYLWQVNGISAWVLGDGSTVPIAPTINAGTAGVQNFFAVLDDRKTWDMDVNAFGLFQTYFLLFSNPFDLAIEPLIPFNLVQPRMELPFEPGTVWGFTGGPHAAWDSGSAWAAVDFAPSDVSACAISSQLVTAVANGFIVRASNGAVMEDLDADGYEQTGWDILYMHMAAQDRVESGTYVYVGDRIGHPSCEGGVANAAHLHLVRKYNGEWIAADGTIPFILGGWTSSGTGVEYDGFLKRGSSTLEAAEGISELNQITR